MGYRDTFMMLSVRKCPPGCSVSHLCNTGAPVPLTVEHFGPIMLHVERFRTDGEEGDRHTIMVGHFSFFRLKPFWQRWFIPPGTSRCEEVSLNVFVDCYPDRDGAKGMLQLAIPEDVDFDELLVSPASE